jgi:hypothetical protein
LREIIGTPEAKITTERGKVFYLGSTDRLLWSDEKIIEGKRDIQIKRGTALYVQPRVQQKRSLSLFSGAPAEKTFERRLKNSFQEIFQEILHKVSNPFKVAGARTHELGTPPNLDQPQKKAINRFSNGVAF